MISIQKNSSTVLGATRVTSIIADLKKELHIPDNEDEELKKIKGVKVIAGELGGKDYEFDRENYVLKIAMAKENVIQDIKKKLKIEQAETPKDKFYIPEESSQDEKDIKPQDELTSEEKKSQASLGFVSDILDRAYNRRTTLTSWILYFMLGLKNDDFGPVSEVLKSSNFARVYTEYRRRAEMSRAGADNYLKTAFEKKEGDKVSPEEKQKLVTRASFLIDTYNKLNMNFVKIFPQIFCIQNIAMPFLKMFLPKVKLFDFMVTVNPWLCDLVSENLGNYAGEIQDIQEVENKEQVISEVDLTPLTFEEFSLQNIVKKINSAVERIFGKDSTVSSIVAKKLLKRFRDTKYEEFAKQFTDDTKDAKDGGFIKNLYEGLKESTYGSGVIVPEAKFDKEKSQEEKDKYWVAAIISRITRVAKSLPEKWIKEYSNLFGAIFVPLNLTMPLIAKVFHKGFLGFITHTLLKVFPIANELVFDHLANFRKEILDIQEETNDESKSISKLFKPIEGTPYEALTTGLKYLWGSIKGFAGRKKPATT